MSKVSSSAVIKQVTTLFQVGSTSGMTDGSLLDRFRIGPADQAEAAFATLVERHGPMVMHVCRRILADRHDAEDAAQATFLVLARQANSIRRMDSVASWLYGVASRVATRLRRDEHRRRLREQRVVKSVMATRRAEQDEPNLAQGSQELFEELDQLPDRFRLPILLCHLEGLTHEQAAHRLGCPVRTVQSRLSRARRRLRDRLTRRGEGPSAAPLVPIVSPTTVSAFATESWKHVTIRASARHGSGGAPSVVASVKVITLAQGVSRTMILARLMKWSAFLSIVGVASVGAGMAMFARSATSTPQAERPDLDAARYRITMAGAVSIEVVAVSTVPTGPDTWWTPGGSRLAEPPVDAIPPMTRTQERDLARVILVRASGLKRDDMFRWHPTGSDSYWGGTPQKDGKSVPGLEHYEAVFSRDLVDCGIEARVAAGPWTTEVSNDGGGGTGQFVNGHKFSFGKARPLLAHGRSMTVFSVAHNFFGQDRRLVAVDREGNPHPAVSYSLGSDGDQKWVLDLIDAEFSLPPEQIREYQVQFRPIAEAQVKAIALNPRPAIRAPQGPPPGTNR